MVCTKEAGKECLPLGLGNATCRTLYSAIISFLFITYLHSLLSSKSYSHFQGPLAKMCDHQQLSAYYHLYDSKDSELVPVH